MPFQFEISDPELLDTLLRVYDDACREVGVTERPSEPAWNSERRARIAAAILERARAGETDPYVLKAAAVSQFLLPR
jgi:hypothetical protein